MMDPNTKLIEEAEEIVEIIEIIENPDESYEVEDEYVSEYYND